MQNIDAYELIRKEIIRRKVEGTDDKINYFKEIMDNEFDIYHGKLAEIHQGESPEYTKEALIKMAALCFICLDGYEK